MELEGFKNINIFFDKDISNISFFKKVKLSRFISSEDYLSEKRASNDVFISLHKSIGTDSWEIIYDSEESLEDSFFIRQGEENRFKQIFELINETIAHQKILNLHENSLIDLENVFKKASSYLETISSKAKELQDVFKFYEKYLKQVRSVLKKDASSDIEILNGISKSVSFDLSFSEEISDNPNFLYLPFNNTSKEKYLKFKSKIKNKSFFQLAVIHNFIDSFYLKRGDEQTFSFEHEIWEEAFQKIDIPMALISENGEVLLHNQSFSVLGILPKECLSFSNESKIEKNENLFRVERNELSLAGKTVNLLSFVSEDRHSRGNKNLTSQELGIVSSSIAHELNNPLAGILASLSLLEIDFDWSPESKSTIADLKSGAWRCKNLIDVFLGFSRMRTFREGGAVIDSFNHALDLLRFRMVESDIRFNFLEKLNFKFQKNVNKSVLSMVFYLILNEILTNYSHAKLINLNQDKTEQSEAKNLEGFLIEDANKIEIQIKDVKELVNLEKSKLLRYLIDYEGMAIEILESRIVLSEWSLM